MSDQDNLADDFYYTANSPHKRNLEEEFDRISINRSPPPKMSRIHDDRDQMPMHTCERRHFFKDRTHRDEELCRACNTVAIQPYTVIECGHTYGKEVIDMMLKSGIREFPCVGDDIDSDDVRPCRSIIKLQDMKPNRAVEKGINKKIVYCPNRSDGCQKEMMLKDEQNHLENECLYQKIKCRSCNQLFPRGKLAAHESTCTAQRCPFSAVGCNDVSSVGDNTSGSGVFANIGVHMALLYQTLIAVKSIADFKPREYNAALTEQQRESEGQDQVTRLLEEPDRIKEEQMSMVEIEKQMVALKQDASNHSVTIAKLMHEDFAIDVAAAWQRQRHRQEFLLLHEEITNEAMGKHMDLIQQAPILLNQGSVIFKVSNFTEKRTSAIQGILKKGIYGPPFFTHEFGYKMVPILYPNGDGAGAGTHLSIFLAVMKGEYDSLQRWPLTGKITISILSQKRVGREAVKHCFRTDVASLSYHRPSGEINQASGIPRALDLALLRQPSDYLVDDTLFIQVMVEPQLPTSSRN